MKCPYCEGEISPTASKCRHCGEWVKTPPSVRSSPPPVPRSAPPPVQPPPMPQQQVAPQQQVTVNVPREESVAFAVVTFVLYIFLYPLAVPLNIIGLITGPRRGCFLAMLIVFLVVPVIVILAIFGFNFDELARWVEKTAKDV